MPDRSGDASLRTAHGSAKAEVSRGCGKPPRSLSRAPPDHRRAAKLSPQIRGQLRPVAGARRDEAQSQLFLPRALRRPALARRARSEEHTSDLQSLMRISYAVFCLKKKTNTPNIT